MALYYKFISAKDYDSISMVAPFISVSELKRQIFESKYKAGKDSKSQNGSCFGTDFDINVINPETNEEYANGSILIPVNSKVLIRRVPGGRGGRNPIDVTPIVVGGEKLPDISRTEESNCSNSSTVTVLSKDSIWSGSSVSGFDFDNDYDDEFGGDVFAVKQDRGGDVCVSGEEDEKGRIEKLVSTPALVWKQQQSSNGVGFVRGDKRVPRAGYVCRRCNVAGHFIHHCPTNSDPNYDFKRPTPPTGVPKSKLAAAVQVPDEAAFEKAMEGVPCAGRLNPAPVIPPELLCSLCKNVMNDAVISSKCCFTSFCYKCIRDLVELKSVCACGAKNMLVDFFIPNLTLRDTINRYLESGFGKRGSSEDNHSSSVCEADSIRVKGAMSNEGGSKKKKRKIAQVEESNENYMVPTEYYGFYPNCVGMNYMAYNYGYNNGLGFYNYD